MSCSGWGGSEAARQIREAFDLTYRSLTMNNRAEVPEGAFRGSPRRCGAFYFCAKSSQNPCGKVQKAAGFPRRRKPFYSPSYNEEVTS